MSLGCKTIADQSEGGMHDNAAGVGVRLGGRVAVAVKVGSPGRWVTRTICVGKLVSVGVIGMFIATVDRTSTVAIAKLPTMMMIEIRAATIPVSTSRRLFIGIAFQDCH